MSAGPADDWLRPAWLTPSAAGALALLAADLPTLLSDAPVVAHVVRFARPELTPVDDPFTPDRLGDPGLLDTLAHGLDCSHAPLPMAPPGPRVMFARRAALLALAPDRDFGVPPGLVAAVVRLVFLGHDAAALAGRPAPPDAQLSARLAARLGLPGFVVTLIATHDLSVADAEACGAHAGLVHAVRAALARAEAGSGAPGAFDTPPRIDRPRLVQLLRATAAARRTGQGAAVESLAESAVRRLAAVQAEFPGRVRDAKLAGLAEFAAGASHEINNPLAVIRGHAQLLLAHEADAGRRAQLKTIVHQTARVHDLLQGTRQFARPPAPRLGAVDVAVAVAGVLDHLRLDAGRRSVTLTAAPAGPLVAAADAGQVAQILTHVIRNAADAAPPGGWVRVTPGVDRERVTIAVEDSGPGPDPAHVPHLFDPFFSGRDAGRGRGLGLSIAWRLAQQNGGGVALTTPPGGATRFTVTLPRHEAAACRRAA